MQRGTRPSSVLQNARNDQWLRGCEQVHHPPLATQHLVQTQLVWNGPVLKRGAMSVDAQLRARTEVTRVPAQLRARAPRRRH